MTRAAVCFDVGVAELLLDAGFGVVIMGADAKLASRRRLAIFIGDPRDETSLLAAIAMATEQFGATPSVVRSLDEARTLLGRS
jgi:hypothetical protein